MVKSNVSLSFIILAFTSPKCNMYLNTVRNNVYSWHTLKQLTLYSLNNDTNPNCNMIDTKAILC